MASGDDADFRSRIAVLERSIHVWDRERKSLEGHIERLEGHIESLEGQVKNLEGDNIILRGQIKYLEKWQIYQAACAELDSMIWGRPFFFGTIGEVFQWCLHRQPSAKHLSNLFWKLRRSSAIRRASTCLCMSAPDFARFADFCIDERNEIAAHFQSVDRLVDAIQHCRDLLVRYPLLQAQFSKQALAISNFELLRVIFNF
jgi:hypothetical protein